MQHNVTLICLGPDPVAPDVEAVTSPAGDFDIVTLDPGDAVAAVGEVGPVLGLDLVLWTLGEDGAWMTPPVTPNPGDTIMVTDAAGRIPDYQVGMLLTVDVDGVAHFVNAGAIADAISRLTPPTDPSVR